MYTYYCRSLIFGFFKLVPFKLSHIYHTFFININHSHSSALCGNPPVLFFSSQGSTFFLIYYFNTTAGKQGFVGWRNENWQASSQFPYIKKSLG